MTKVHLTFIFFSNQIKKIKEKTNAGYTTDILICQAENGFSLDELVKKFTDAFENKAFAEILKMNLPLTQEVLMHRIFNNSSNQQCCPDGHLTLNGSFERRIRTV